MGRLEAAKRGDVCLTPCAFRDPANSRCVRDVCCKTEANGDTDAAFRQKLERHLQKCEIEFCADQANGHCIGWLAKDCDSTEAIAAKLRELGFAIHEVKEERNAEGEALAWVETTSSIIVYVNTPCVRGLVWKRSAGGTRKGGKRNA